MQHCCWYRLCQGNIYNLNTLAGLVGDIFGDGSIVTINEVVTVDLLAWLDSHSDDVDSLIILSVATLRHVVVIDFAWEDRSIGFHLCVGTRHKNPTKMHIPHEHCSEAEVGRQP